MTDKEYYQLTISISKALNDHEIPLKTKHARAAIIGTFHTQGAHSFWAITLRQPLQENRITAWKFCHLLHKVLREGHPLCCQHSMRHRGMITEMGKLWGHLNDGYGLSIRHYTKLLVTKLEFHDRNPRFPGNLTLKRGELEMVTGNDINSYFQLAVEMFDYLDDIIALQATIFNSLSTFHVNSMTSAGQCRLAPLIPLIQDSNPLYDFLVRIMFKLHGNLPNDVLIGHRDRFRAIFTQLKSFYNQSRNLQYFLNLITVPKLPENGPNFSSQLEFGSYAAPVVVIPEPEPEPEPDPIVDNLLDMTVAVDQHPHSVSIHQQQQQQQQYQDRRHQNNEPKIDYERIIHDRDDLILHLQTEVDRLGKCLKMISTEHRDDCIRFEEKMSILNTQLSDAQEEVMNIKFVKEELELRAQTAEKVQVEGEKIKAYEEKFSKLKTMYGQIREEHVKLLRQHGDVKKQMSALMRTQNDILKEKEEAMTKYEELQTVQTRAEEQLQRNSIKLDADKKDTIDKILMLQNENSMLSAKFDDLQAKYVAQSDEFANSKDNLEKEIVKLKENQQCLYENNVKLTAAAIIAKDKQLTLEKEMNSQTVALETLRQESLHQSIESNTLQQMAVQTNDKNIELNETIESLQEECENFKNSIDKLNTCNHTIEMEKKDLEFNLVALNNEKSELIQQYEISNQEIQQLKSQLNEQQILNDTQKQEFATTLNGKLSEIFDLENKLKNVEQKYEKVNTNIDRIQNEKDSIETDLQDLLHEQEEMTDKYQTAQSTIAALEITLSDGKIREDARLRGLMEACIKSSEKLIVRAIKENEMIGATGTIAYFTMIADELQTVLNQLIIVYDSYVTDHVNAEGLARKIIFGGHLMATVHTQGIIICSTSADIDGGEKISNEIKEWSNNLLELFAGLCTINESATVKTRIDVVKKKLQHITALIYELSKKSNSTEIIGDIIENELAEMDKAIEEAASSIEKMLSNSRQSDSGIKLEVNEKILDACTTLMNNIRILVKKSRCLQAEIVLLGKGTASAKEFYKRNHQWTEGLISAAKSVAQGANFLVTAANKTVLGESKHQLDLIVAAQEIAACTAQLVVSSRVKAPRESTNLNGLYQASRDVTQATGAVVATVKDCGHRLEDSQDLDITTLTVHQAKTLEMEIQVKVLALEQGLQSARLKLAAFRRQNYRES